MSEIIYLSVGGVKYETTLMTLLADKNSMLSAMFSGRHSIIRNTKGYYFIDRDGKLFRYILNYLRTQEILIPRNKQQLISELLIEAEYFQLNSLVAALQEMKTKSEMPSISYKKMLALVNQSKPLQAPYLNLSMLSLRYLDFTDANLQACDFSYTSIYEVNFSHAQLSGCIFDFSVVQNSIFIDATMIIMVCLCCVHVYPYTRRPRRGAALLGDC